MENNQNKIQEEINTLNLQLPTEVPKDISKTLFKTIHREETLGTDNLMKKIAGMQILFTLLSFVFCGQFGLQFKYGLHSLFFMLGDNLGNLFAGMFYGLFNYSLLTLFVFTSIDRYEISKDKFKYIGLANLFALIFMGLFGDVSFLNSLIWFAGAHFTSVYVFDQADNYIKLKN